MLISFNISYNFHLFKSGIKLMNFALYVNVLRLSYSCYFQQRFIDRDKKFIGNETKEKTKKHEIFMIIHSFQNLW